MKLSRAGQSKAAQGDYLPTLDGWRAIAIALVLFAHVRLPGNALQPVAEYGAIGVHLFFAISGFLITNRLLEEWESTGRVSLRSFYIRRGFRILPAAFTYLLVLCIPGFVCGWIPLTKGQILSSALFFRNYWVEPVAQSWYTGHYWSLSVEEHFYLLWPGLLVALGVSRMRWATPMLAVAFAVWRALDSQFAWVTALNPAWKDLVGRTDYRMDGLLWGCAAAFIWDSRPARSWLGRWARGEYAFVAIALIAVCLIFEPPGFVALLALLMPVPLIMTTADPNRWPGRLLESRLLRWFGRLSYSVYLWQMLFLPAYGVPVLLGWAQGFPVNLMLILASATASYYLVERPFRRLGRQLAKRQTEQRESKALASATEWI